MPRARTVSQDAVRFGAIVRRLRMHRGWTIVDFARFTKMSAHYLGVLERGGNVPTLDTILQLTETLGVEAAEVFRELELARKRPVAANVHP